MLKQSDSKSSAAVRESCSHPSDCKTGAIKLAFGNQIEAVDERSTKSEKVTSLKAGRCSFQVKVCRNGSIMSLLKDIHLLRILQSCDAMHESDVLL